MIWNLKFNLKHSFSHLTPNSIFLCHFPLNLSLQLPSCTTTSLLYTSYVVFKYPLLNYVIYLDVQILLCNFWIHWSEVHTTTSLFTLSLTCRKLFTSIILISNLVVVVMIFLMNGMIYYYVIQFIGNIII